MPKYRIDGEVIEAGSPDEAYRKAIARNNPGFFGGLAQQFNQGLTMGGADELQAGAEAALGGQYLDSMNRQRRQRNAFQAQNPWLSAGATAAGAILPTAAATFFGGPVGGGVTGTRALQMTLNALYGGGNALRNVKTVTDAAREGARYGLPLGMASGALSADPGSRTQGAITGGAVGTTFGAGFGGGSQALASTRARVSPYLRKVVDFFGLSTDPGVSRMVPGTAPAADIPLSAAEIKILEALERAGVTPEAAAMRLTRAREQGVPLGLVDVGGQNTQRLARGVRSAGGEGGEIIDSALANRASGQRDRVVNFLERALGRKASGDAGTTADTLLNQARTDAGPLYRQLDSLPPIADENVLMRFELPAVKRIIQGDEANRRDWGYTVDSLYDDAGNLLRAPTFREVDIVNQRIKEGMAFSPVPRPQDPVDFGTRATRGRAGERRIEILRDADNAPGGDVYSSARQSYATPAAARENYELGVGFPSAPLADVRALTADASPANLKWYQRGVVESLRSGIDRMPDLASQPNVLRSFYGNREARAKLDAVVPPRRAEDLRTRLDLENQAAQTGSFVRGGSPSVDKAFDAADAVDVAADMAGAASAGGLKGTFVEGISRLYNSLRSSVNEKTRAEIARQLTNFNDPAAQQAFLQRLIEQQRRAELRAQDVTATARAMTVQNEVE